MQTAAVRKTDLVHFLTLLEKGGVITTEQSKSALIELRPKKLQSHPINQIAQLKIKSVKFRNKILTAELLTEWYAAQIKLPYVRLDPLKIDVDSVTSVMSKAFALRHN
ncbi:MAG: hypothetical protein OQK04_08200, partial [Kangiellaceae bacterium]|nr:hypothetical protein [Kangiellaceae bacterium]